AVQFRPEVEHERASLADELATHEGELVPLQIDQPPIRNRGGGEAGRQILHAERSRDLAGGFERSVVMAQRNDVRAVFAVELPQDVLVRGRPGAGLRFGCEILNVALDDWLVAAPPPRPRRFRFVDPIDQLLERQRRRTRRWLLLLRVERRDGAARGENES